MNYFEQSICSIIYKFEDQTLCISAFTKSFQGFFDFFQVVNVVNVDPQNSHDTTRVLFDFPVEERNFGQDCHYWCHCGTLLPRP